MADTEDKSQSFRKSEERYRYIGFDVFPGKPGNIFKSDEERKSLIEKVMRKLNRSDGEVRDRCTLMEDRLSHLEKIFLTIASVALVISLILPWFSGYHEIVTTRQVVINNVEEPAGAAEGDMAAPDSLAAMAATAETGQDMAAVPSGSETAAEQPGAIPEETPATAETATEGESETSAATESQPVQEIQTVTEVNREFTNISAIGAIAALGSYGSMVFSSGVVLVLSGILMIVFILSCLVLAGVNLYALYGVKIPDPEKKVLFLKKMLRYNWIPILVFFALFILSFIGADYGFDTSGTVKQIGKSYSVMTFVDLTFGQMSYGFILAFMSFWVLALKGKEI